MDGASRPGTGRGPRQRRPRAARGLLPQLDGDHGSCPPWATACATSTVSFSQAFRNGWQEETPDNWLSIPTRGRSCAARDASRCRSTARSNCATARSASSRPALDALGLPYDRPVVGYGGKTINTLRLWGASATAPSTSSDSAKAISSARWPRTLGAESLTRVLYPDIPPAGPGLRFIQEYFLVACSLADLLRRFGRLNADCGPCPTRRPSSSTTPIRRSRCRADAHPARREGTRLGSGLGHHPADALLHQSHAAPRGAGAAGRSPGSDDAPAPSRDHL